MREFWVPFADKRYKRKETRNHRLRHLLRLGQRPTPAAAEDESGDNIGRRTERILRVCAQTRFAAIEGGRAAKNRREKDLGDKDCNPQNCASRSLRQRRLATKRSISCTFSRLSIARASSALPSAYRKGCFALRRLRSRQKRKKTLALRKLRLQKPPLPQTAAAKKTDGKPREDFPSIFSTLKGD